jgi:hypothetical protein
MRRHTRIAHFYQITHGVHQPRIAHFADNSIQAVGTAFECRFSTDRAPGRRIASDCFVKQVRRGLGCETLELIGFDDRHARPSDHNPLIATELIQQAGYCFARRARHVGDFFVR